jgi:DNA-binding CsgD family transcriptional regulator
MTLDRQPAVLFERGEQIAKAEAAILAARSGAGHGVLLEGAAGIGKTSVLRIAARRAGEAGLRVLEARGDELEADLPWGVVVQLYGRLADEEGAFAGAAGLTRALFETGAGPAAPGPPDLFPILHGLHWLTSNLAEADPLLLIVDDAHRCDPQSLRFASYLLGRIETMPVALVLAGRTGEPGNAVPLAHVRGRVGSEASTLQPLGATSIEAIVAARLPASEPVFRAAIATRVAGNPFFCAELLRAVSSEGIAPDAAGAERIGELLPDGISRAIAARLRRLGPETGRLAAAVAVLGGGATLDLARRLADLDEPTAVDRLDALLAADILAVDPTLGFVHPVVAEAVEAELGTAARRALHLDAARLFHQRGAPAETVATHLLPAAGIGAEPWAVPTLRAAAAQAMARGAPERAAALLERAVAETAAGDAALLLEAGNAEATLYRPGAIALFGAALEVTDDPGQRIVALAGLARGEYMAGDTAAAVSRGRSALESVPPGEGGAIEAEILSFIAMAARANPDLLAEFPKVLERPRLGPSGEPTAAEFVRLAFDAMDLALRGDRGGAAARVERARAQVPVDDGPLLLVAWGILAFTLINLGRYAEAEEIAERMLSEGRAAGNRFVVGLGYEMRGHARWARGDIGNALAETEWIVEYFKGNWETSTIPLRAFRSLAMLEAGRADEAVAVLDVPAELESRAHGSWAWLWLPYGRAHLAFAAGDFELAAAEARLAGERQAAMEVVNYENLAWRPLGARALSRAGRQEEALALATEDIEWSARYCSPRAGAVALATAAAIEGGEDGEERLLDAIAGLDALGAELDAARARLDLGMLRRRLRRARDARRPLAEAIDLAGRLGAHRLGAAAELQLRLAGGRPRRLALSGVGSLTPGQRRVAELAAEGLSNPEVAQALFVSVRTVETHLTATYAKLEIESREQLSGALRGRDGDAGSA